MGCAPGKSCSALASLLKVVPSLLGPIPAGIPQVTSVHSTVMLLRNPLISSILYFVSRAFLMRSLAVSISLACSGAGFPCLKGSPTDWGTPKWVLLMPLCQARCPSSVNSSPALVWSEGSRTWTEGMAGSGQVRENIWREHLETQLLCSCQPCTALIPPSQIHLRKRVGAQSWFKSSAETSPALLPGQ